MNAVLLVYFNFFFSLCDIAETDAIFRAILASGH